jgi:hypothetical protein
MAELDRQLALRNQTLLGALKRKRWWTMAQQETPLLALTTLLASLGLVFADRLRGTVRASNQRLPSRTREHVLDEADHRCSSCGGLWGR